MSDVNIYSTYYIVLFEYCDLRPTWKWIHYSQ